MNRIILILVIFVIISCKQENKTNSGLKSWSNLDLRHKIDSIKERKIIYEYQVDSLDNILDTISVEINKVDQKNNLLYKRKITFSDNEYFITVDYHQVNGNLFYKKSESSSLGTLLISEFWQNKQGEITDGISFGYTNNMISDTINSEYNRIYDSDKNILKTTVLSRFANENSFGNKTEMYYHNNELISEIMLSSLDTIMFKEFEYENGTLKKQKIHNYNTNQIINIEYDKNGTLLLEEVYNNRGGLTEKISAKKYLSNKNGDIIKTVKTYYPSFTKEYSIFVYEENDLN